MTKTVMVMMSKGRRNDNFRRTTLRVISVFLLTALLCLGITYDVAGQAPAAAPVIKAIEVEDYVVRITVDGPISYTIQVPDDPFRIIVSIDGVSMGSFVNPINSTKAGISEITPSQSATYKPGTDLNILMHSPMNIRSEVVGDSLVLSLQGGARKAAAPQSVKSKAQVAKSEAQAAPPAATVAPPPSEEPFKDEEAAKAQPAEAPKEIRDIYFDKDERRLALILKSSGPMPEPTLYRGTDRIIVEIPDVVMKADVPRDTPLPIKEIIQATTDTGRVRVMAMYEGKVRTEAYTIDDEIVVAFFTDDGAAPKVAQTETVIPSVAAVPKVSSGNGGSAAMSKQSSLLALPSTPKGVAGAGNGRNNNAGKRLNLEFQDADLVSILKTLSDVGGYNIIIHPDVKGKVTMKLTDVTWEQALDSLVKTFGLAKTVDGTIIRVMPQALANKENEEILKAKEFAKKVEVLETRHYPVHYSDVYGMEQAIKEAKVLSDRGSISAVAAPTKDRQQMDAVDKFASPKSTDRFYRKRAGVLIVTDIPPVFPTVERLIEELDKKIPQVLIEARIVEMDTTVNRDLGVEWNIQYKAPNTLSAIGATIPFSPSPGATDYIGSKSSSLSFGVISPAGTLSIDAKLSAIEGADKGRVISSPKILTTVNEKARIMQGQSIPYVKEISKEGTASVDFKDVAIIIDVTPQIGPNNTVLLNVTTTKEDLILFKQIASGVSGGAEAPLTSKIEGSTSVIVENGGTFVVGGIFQSKERTRDTGTPWVKDVPLLGWLFKTEKKHDETREMMIFITPKIVENVLTAPEAQTVLGK